MNIVWNLEENVCLSHFLFFWGGPESHQLVREAVAS